MISSSCLRLVPLSLVTLLSVACSAGTSGADGSGGGIGSDAGAGAASGNGTGGTGSGFTVGSGTGGGTEPGDMDPEEDCDATLELIVRDFNTSHIDFERAHPGEGEVGCGMVKTDLLVGEDGTRTPQFQASKGTGKHVKNDDGTMSCNPYGISNPEPQSAEIENEASFNDWFTNVDGVNQTFSHKLDLLPVEGTDNYYFDSGDAGFFPADGLGFNEQSNGNGAQHNFHFTTEAHVRFGYAGGERFTFKGDDDLWVFVNGKLALDLGGLHAEAVGTLDFDKIAGELGITKGNVYNMDIFHAERHTGISKYRVETNIKCFEVVQVPEVVVR